MKPWLAAFVLWSTPAALAAADDDVPDLTAYHALVRRCVDDDPGAVAELAGWPKKRLDALKKRLPASDCKEDCLRVAALAHTAAAFEFLPRQVHPYFRKPWPHHPHLALAEWLLARGPLDDFRREWTLAVGYRLQEWTDFQGAHRFIDLALEHWPRDAEAHVAMGSLYELLDAMPQRSAAFVDGPRLAKAAQHYRRALAHDAAHEEARLRLGRVLVRGGDVPRGSAELRRLLEARPPPEVAAFAHLFLGDALRATGIETVAVEAYRAALSENPRLLPAQLALAEALHHAGRSPEALPLLREGLGAPAAEIDSWFGYHATLLHGYRHSLARLKARVAR